MMDPFFKPVNRASAQAIINDRASSSAKIGTFAFPPDLPKYYTLLLEHTWETASITSTDSFRKLKIKNGYRLPLPTHIIDGHEVQYDHNFNWMSLGGGLIANLAGAAGQAIGQAAKGTFGFALNNFKFVTLQSPQFRSYAFEWRLYPKSAEESDSIRMIYSLIKKGMHPSRELKSLVFRFPNIFWLGFYPNADYLVKFKPAVITSCQIDYQGGNPVPTFYKGTGAPESIILRLTFLELEVWSQDNFNSQFDNYPYNAADWYKQVDPT